MNFFEHQDAARRNTTQLLMLFVLGVVCTVGCVDLLLLLVLGSQKMSAGGMVAFMAVASACTLLVIGAGSAIKASQMMGGGRAVAEALGGTQVLPSTRDPDERRALNVVEEMAIASGMPVPPVYVTPERSINAFAAGRTQKEYIIGLTRGCIKNLSRDELQGVVAHEFSHLFHQDTRMNMRLVAWLGGILALSLIGRAILREARFSSNRKSGGAPLALGLGLMAIGGVGYFFGRLIQSAVSRQREFLADASAVQYTRNPDGLASALEAIRIGPGSAMEAPRATEFSHFFFASGLNAMFATHPPLEERIRRIRGVKPGQALPEDTATRPRMAVRPQVEEGIAAIPPVQPAVELLPVSGVGLAALRSSLAGVGKVSPTQLANADRILSTLPKQLVEATQSPFSARAVICGMLLPQDFSAASTMMDLIRTRDLPLADTVNQLAPALQNIHPAQRLPLLSLCAASMALMSPQQYAEFRQLLLDLAGLDRQLDRLEWTVRIILRRAVERRGSGDELAPHPGLAQIRLVTGVLSYAGARNMSQAEHAWRVAAAAAPGIGQTLPTLQECTLDALDAALRSLDRGTMRQKRVAVEACVAAVCADGVATPDEAELFRAICDAIGVPVPPLPIAA
ncbi:MAG: M48 family metalloprotease [Phycisphaerales bacterium]